MRRLGVALASTALLLAGCGGGGTEVADLDDLASQVKATGALTCDEWTEPNEFGYATEARDCGNSADTGTDYTMIAVYPSSDAAKDGAEVLVMNDDKPVAYGPNWSVKGDGADKVADELGGEMAEPEF